MLPEAPSEPATDKERLYKKLWEENNFLKTIHSKKKHQMTQLKERIALLTEGISKSDFTIKTQGSDLLRLKSAIEEAQNINVTSF